MKMKMDTNSRISVLKIIYNLFNLLSLHDMTGVY